MEVFDFDTPDGQEPFFLFKDKDFIYVVHANSRETMKTSGPMRRIHIAHIVVSRRDNEVVKNRYS